MSKRLISVLCTAQALNISVWGAAIMHHAHDRIPVPASMACGARLAPVPVYHHDHVAFYTTQVWCPGDVMRASQVQPPVNAGDVIRCMHGDALDSLRELSYIQGAH